MESSKKSMLKNGVDKQKRKTLGKPKSKKDRIDERSQWIEWNKGKKGAKNTFLSNFIDCFITKMDKNYVIRKQKFINRDK
jgi:hypothetical protein